MKMQSFAILFAAALVTGFAINQAAAQSPDATEATNAKPRPSGQRDPKAVDEEEQLYIRVLRDDDDQPLTMETAIVSYELPGKKNRRVQVDLIGAVHIGDKAYYDELNKVFEDYDVLLYELVAPEGTKIPKGGRKGGGSLIGSLQGGMKSVLELEHQLERIDYTKENFVHADMSPEEFAKSMKDRGESFLGMIFKAMGQSAAMQGAQGAKGRQVSDVDILQALFAKDRALRLKRIAANQFEDLDAATTLFDGEDGSTILTERNKKCMAVLKRELENGHKKIGIFYGAAHLPDMDERLINEFEMKRAGTRWVVAWKLGEGKPAVEDQPKADPPKADEAEVPDSDKVEPKSKKERRAQRRRQKREKAAREANEQSP